MHLACQSPQIGTAMAHCTPISAFLLANRGKTALPTISSSAIGSIRAGRISRYRQAIFLIYTATP